MGSDTKLCREKKSQSLLRQDRGPGSSGTVAIAGAVDEPRVCSSEGFSAEMDPRPGGSWQQPARGTRGMKGGDGEMRDTHLEGGTGTQSRTAT